MVRRRLTDGRLNRACCRGRLDAGEAGDEAVTLRQASRERRRVGEPRESLEVAASEQVLREAAGAHGEGREVDVRGHGPSLASRATERRARRRSRRAASVSSMSTEPSRALSVTPIGMPGTPSQVQLSEVAPLWTTGRSDG